MSPAPRLPAQLDRCSLSLGFRVGRWRTQMETRKTGVSHTPNALAMVKDARKGRASRRMLAGVGMAVAIATLFSAAAFASLIPVVNVSQHATDYQGASSNDPDYPTPSTTTLQPNTLASSDIVSGDCMVTGVTNPGTYTGTGISNAGPTFVSVDANNTGAACQSGWFDESFTFHPAATLVAETLKLQITTTFDPASGGSNVTYSATVTEAVTAGATSGNEAMLIVDVTWGLSYPAGGVQSLNIVVE
jgi:hypothetical protein